MTTEKRQSTSDAQSLAKPICGIIMPISAIDDCLESHWLDVKLIVSEAIIDAGFEPNLVSNAEFSGVIQKSIVQNVYENAMIVCDVSGRNPNVMMELGMRLAFDKPVVIIKDDKTPFSFDTSIIEHIPYPRDLRFNTILGFKNKLTEKIRKTHAASADLEYTSFLKHFGTFKTVVIPTENVSAQDYTLMEIRDLKATISNLARKIQGEAIRPSSPNQVYRIEIPAKDDQTGKDALRFLASRLSKRPLSASIRDGKCIIDIGYADLTPRDIDIINEFESEHVFGKGN